MGAGGPVGVGIGKLRDRVTFQSPVRTKQATGQQKVTGWADEATVFARVVPAAEARELRSHAQQVALGDFAVTVRGGVEVKHDWQVLWGGLTLAVVAVIRDGSGVANAPTILCREAQPATG